MKKDFTFNYYTYNVVNFNTGRILYETDNLEDAKGYKRLINANYSKYIGIQQLHTIARIIN